MNQETTGGVRCHDADACAMGQNPCPTPKACGCAVQQGYVPAGAVMQIQDAGQLPEIKDMLNAPQILNKNDRAFWVLGWNECRDAAKPLIARIAELEAQLAAAPQAVPASVIAGAIFDFAGYLTTLPVKDAIHCSEAHEASPMVDAITEWCKRRDLCADGAQVTNWRDSIATQQGLDAGSKDADRVIGRLLSSDPDFEDCTEAANLIRELTQNGPDGFATWKDAAVSERVLRVDMQRVIRALPRFTYGYKSDGESRYLASYESSEGQFLRYADVMAAIAAQAKQGGA